MNRKELYTASQAAARLGITTNQFHYLVRTGRIIRYNLPLSKQGYYSKKEIDELVEQIEQVLAEARGDAEKK